MRRSIYFVFVSRPNETSTCTTYPLFPQSCSNLVLNIDRKRKLTRTEQEQNRLEKEKQVSIEDNIRDNDYL
jgi:hypothetical protein